MRKTETVPVFQHIRRAAFGLVASLLWAVPGLVGQVVMAQEADSEWVTASVYDLQNSNEQWIQVDLSDQVLVAWEGNTPVFSISVSTGRVDEATPIGVYAIETKYRTARMQGDSYDIPDVPYTMYFSGSYAIHGAYWHDNFGSPVSSGCINVPIDGAAWLFDWASTGTPVVVQN